MAAFPVRHFIEDRKVKTIKGKSVTVERVGDEVNISIEGQKVPGYYEM